MKIYVYTIAKNESKFVHRWAESTKDADGRFVLDTGSTDDTVQLLVDEGIDVHQYLYHDHFRFDRARNDNLALIPKDADLLICLDMDEVLCEGWRDILESKWDPSFTTVRYTYVWSHNADGSDGHKFFGEKIHIPRAKWTHPVHEILKYDVPRKDLYIPELRIDHYPDSTKSRGQYLGLLELSVREDPYDDRNAHYLGREYMFAGRYEDAIKMLTKHIQLPTAKWDVERAASMRYISKCYAELNNYDMAELWGFRACMEVNRRENWYNLGKLYYTYSKWKSCEFAMTQCINIDNRALDYTSDPVCWGSDPYDILSVAAYNTGDYKMSLICAREANRLNPTDDRIKKNIELIERRLKGAK